MFTTIINDCRDANAEGRQASRVSALTGAPVNFVGVKNPLEAAGNIIDTIDATGDEKAMILVNVAPRHGKAKKWPNGTPFGYFWYNEILVVSTVDDVTLSLVKKFGLADSITVFEYEKTVDAMIKEGFIKEESRDRVNRGQFRSFDFVPRAAAFVLKHGNVEGEKLDISEIPDAPHAVWWVDNFGNCKTTVLADEVDENSESDFLKKLAHYPRLKDVPNDEVALVTGSSGLGERRFLEIVAQGKSAAEKLGLSSGDLVE
ncbi:MAG: SAM-dependent chlorinase/fluorinase [Candidatus Moranbacteria bacterium]|nr:SAM-dependent chlorinase/fluorinase [Candidatus Moranbacteria bacterium]